MGGEETVCLNSQLKLWNVGKSYCLPSFKGHIIEKIQKKKTFVGLASKGDYVAPKSGLRLETTVSFTLLLLKEK